MKISTYKFGLLLPLLLAAMVLRGFVPAGYMPASPGDGLLFVLCHESAMLELAPASQHGSHAQHAGDHSHHDGDQPAADSCSLGHMLSMAFVDDSTSPDLLSSGFDGFEPLEPVTRLHRQHVNSLGPRGPPRV